MSHVVQDGAATGNGAAPFSAPDRAALRIVAFAADLFAASAAMLVLREGARGTIVARHGFAAAPRDLAWDLPLSAAAPWAAGDAAEPGVAALDQAVAPLRLRAGAPLMSAGGGVVGALCILDRRPAGRTSDVPLGRLAELAAIAADAGEERRSRDRAEAELAAKVDLLADLSHELRTPLNGILGFAQLLRRDGLVDPRGQRSVDRIEEAGRALLTMAGNALDLARLEADALRLTPRPFLVGRLVEDAVAMVGAEAERKGLRLVVDLPEAPLVPLLGDADRLRQVLLNLLSNAVKFTGTGTVRVGVSAGRTAHPRAPVPLTLVVEDSGVGIDGGGISRLFQRFAQADGSVSRRFGGTGLGLAISKRIVEAMGGAIAVSSAPGSGARFSVTLVLPRAPEAAPPARAAEADARGTLRGSAVLVADDSAMNRKLVSQILAPFGPEIDAVEDGGAAVAAVGRRAYALVLMDMEMPVMGGLEAARRIRALDGPAAEVPIVALTANAFPEQLALCREAGMDDHLTKPFTPDDLAATALRWARGGRDRGEGAP
jgi:signal transduction histidine kinase/ActR/RegA family two-component response regulator